MAEVNLTSNTILSEEHLRQMSKNIGSMFKGIETGDETNISKSLQCLVDSLLVTAFDGGLTPSHRVATHNVLCGVIDRCLRSHHEMIHSIACATDLFSSLLRMYLDFYDSAKHKSMKQVLVTLSKLLKQLYENDENLDLQKMTLARLFEILFRDRQHSKATPALQALIFFLNKHIIRFSVVVSQFAFWLKEDTGIIQFSPLAESPLQVFLAGILEWICYPDVASIAGHCVTAFCELQQSFSSDSADLDRKLMISPIWAPPLFYSLDKHMNHLTAFEHHVFPTLFRLNFADYWQFLQDLQFENYMSNHRVSRGNSSAPSSKTYFRGRECILFMAMQVGKDIGFVQVIENDSRTLVSIQQDVVLIPYVLVKQLLMRASPVARLAALSLLVTSTRLSQPFTEASFKCFRRNLPHMCTDSDASFRGEMCGLVQKLIARLKAAICSLARASQKQSHYQSTYKTSSCDFADQEAFHLMQINKTLKAHRTFISWFHDFLAAELHPENSYQSHISCLKILSMLVRSGLNDRINDQLSLKQPDHQINCDCCPEFISTRVRRLLVDMLLDPFEDVRQGALKVLKAGSVQWVKESYVSLRSSQDHARYVAKAFFPTSEQDILVLKKTVERAYHLMVETDRVYHADGLARIYDLLSYCQMNKEGSHVSQDGTSHNAVFKITLNLVINIEQAVCVAKKQLFVAISNHPIYGLFTALRYVLTNISGLAETSMTSGCELESLFDRIDQSLDGVWAAVHDVLCHDAPEGFMPQDTEVQIDLTTRDVLSYSWRALKESSLLLRALVSSKLSQRWRSREVPDTAALERYGDLCFSQLSQLRHRGAFSTVAESFAVVCEQCSNSNTETTRQLVSKWYAWSLSLITDKGSMITRRSAGIPALIIGVLTAETSSKLLKRVMQDLWHIIKSCGYGNGESSNQLPQVHAINCLKAIFSTPKLALHTEDYIFDGFTVVSTCIGSPIWAIRNCGSMLSRSLIDRCISANELFEHNSTTSGFAQRLYTRNPRLLDILLKHLRAPSCNSDGTTFKTLDVNDISSEAVFPILDILRNLPPPDITRELRSFVLEAASSAQWHIRVMAARTFSNLVRDGNVLEEVRGISRNLALTHNAIHGRLLCIKHLVYSAINRFHDLPKGMLNALFNAVTALSHDIMHQNSCHFTKTAYLDCINSFGSFLLVNHNSDVKEFGWFQLLIKDFIHACTFLKANSTKATASSSQALLVIRATKLALMTSSLLSVINLEKKNPAEGLSVITAQRETLLELTDGDPETSSYLMETVGDIIMPAESATCELLEELLAAMAVSAGNPRSRHVARCVLTGFLSRAMEHPEWPKRTEMHRYLGSLQFSECFGSYQAPSIEVSMLKMWGCSIDAKRYLEGRWTRCLLMEMKVWLQALRAALHESSDFPTREAAAISMNGLRFVYEEQPELPNNFYIDLCLIVYDTLNDDDEDIRELGAKIALRIVAASRRGVRYPADMVPLVASRMMCGFLVRKHDSSVQLLQEAIRRLFGDTAVSNTGLRPFKDILQEVSHLDTSLFEEEKQNLYIDDVREAFTWSRVLKRLNVTALPKRLAQHLSQWVIDALDVLTVTAKSRIDGPLGWTAKSDVFTLGMRIIYAADVLLEWRAKTRKIKTRGSLIRRKLQEFADAGRESELQGLWLSEIDAILERSVMRRLRRIHSSLSNLPGGSALKSEELIADARLT